MKIKSFFKSLYDFDIKSDVLDPSTFQGFGFLGSVHGGVKVNVNSALAHDTIFSCIRDKAESIGQLPVKLKRTTDGKTEIVKSGREFKLFTKKPNEYQTMQEMIEMYVASIESRGAFYAYIVRNKYNNISEILPFRNQGGVGVNMDTNGRVYYTYTTNDGKPNIAMSNRDIIHIKNFTLDGFTGLGAIKQGARAIGVAISQEEYLSNLMSDGAMPKGILHTEATFDDRGNAVQRLREQWKEFSGSKGVGKTPILEQGLKYQALTISPADSELIAQRGYSREQICAMLRVPPHRVGAATKSKVDVEQTNKDYYQNSLVPLVIKFENAMNFVLPDHLNIKLDESGFTRGDLESTIKAAHDFVKSGLGSMNEGREIMDYEPIDGGEVHAIDTNNLTFGLVTDIPKIQEQNRLLLQQGSNNNSGSEEDE